MVELPRDHLFFFEGPFCGRQRCMLYGIHRLIPVVCTVTLQLGGAAIYLIDVLSAVLVANMSRKHFFAIGRLFLPRIMGQLIVSIILFAPEK